MGGEPVSTQARRTRTSGDTRARSPAPAALQAVRRAASGTGGGGRDFRPGDDPALGLQRLSGSRWAGRPARRAASPTVLARLRPQGIGIGGLRGSPSGSQPCGSRTRLRGCNLSQDRPIVPVRSRLLSHRAARPGPCWPSASWLSPAQERVPIHTRYGPADSTGILGLLGQGSFALCSGATVKKIGRAHV